MKFQIICFLLFLISLTFTAAAKDESRPEFKKYFDRYQVEGTFVFYDAANKKFIRYNPQRAKQTFVPASTFKIVNSMIGLETGEIPDETYVFRWDGNPRPLKTWEKDFDLKGAFQASCVSCYQELARRIGAGRMQSYLNKLKYGNRDISGGIDQFWLTGGLRISANEEIEFLRRLHDEKLPISKRSQQIVRKIMLREETPGYKIYGKTGWQTDNLAAPVGLKSLGWYVGYVEQNGNVYYFALNIDTHNTRADFAAARTEIVNKILKDLKLL